MWQGSGWPKPALRYCAAPRHRERPPATRDIRASTAETRPLKHGTSLLQARPAPWLNNTNARAASTCVRAAGNVYMAAYNSADRRVERGGDNIAHPPF
jgi:hypothetical protein